MIKFLLDSPDLPKDQQDITEYEVPVVAKGAALQLAKQHNVAVNIYQQQSGTPISPFTLYMVVHPNGITEYL